MIPHLSAPQSRAKAVRTPATRRPGTQAANQAMNQATNQSVKQSVKQSVNQPGLHMRAMAVELPEVHGHPNRLPFEGCLTLVDVPSDRAPSGARGHRVVLTREAAELGLPSLLGMAVDYKAGWDGHDARQKCGIITEARVSGSRLLVAGYLFARDFPEFHPQDHPEAARGGMEARGEMGMSYELADAHVEDMRASIWTLTRATFTGAAILLRDKAAYRDTSFQVRRGPAKKPVRSAPGSAALNKAAPDKTALSQTRQRSLQ